MPFGDPHALPKSELRVGWYVDDGLVAPSRALSRAVHEASVALRDAGFEVKPFAPPGTREAAYRWLALMTADGAKTAWSKLEGSRAEPTLKPNQRLATMPEPARRLLARVMRAAGEGRTAELLEVVGEKTVTEAWKLVADARAYRLRFLEAMRDAGVDVLLCPPHATPAVPHGASPEFTLGGSYCMLYNLLQFPAGIVPVTKVREGETSRAHTGDRLDARAAAIDAKSAGLPVGVQVVAAPFRDERAIAVMAALEQAFAGRPETPRTPIEPR
jgi:fatty acid amide hydrolase